jgi:hypothetical protein
MLYSGAPKTTVIAVGELARVSGKKKVLFAPTRATAKIVAMTTEEALVRARATASLLVLQTGGTLIRARATASSLVLGTRGTLLRPRVTAS